MKEWSSPTSQRVATMLRSIPVGRGGAGGTSPSAMRSVQSESDFSVGSLPIWPSSEYILVPRTPTPRRHSQASVWVLSSGLAAKTCVHVARQRIAELMAEIATRLQRIDPMVLSQSFPVPGRCRCGPVPGNRFFAGGAIIESQ